MINCLQTSLYRNFQETHELCNVLSSNIMCKPLVNTAAFFQVTNLKHCFVLALGRGGVGHRLVAEIVCCHHLFESYYLKDISVSEWASLSCHSQLEE